MSPTADLLTCVFLLATAPAHPAPPPPNAPIIVKSEPLPDWNAHFAGKDGWVGGDCAYSVVLGDRRILWLFGDTLLGKVTDGGRPGAAMVNNTIGIQAGQTSAADIRFVAGKGKEDKPTALITPADSRGWFWPQAGIRIGDRLWLFLAQVDKVKGQDGAFGFTHIGQVLARIANPDDDPSKWRIKQIAVPFTAFGPEGTRSWGAALLLDGENLTIYGYTEKGKDLARRRLTVAKVPAAKLDDFTAWRFRTADGWSDKPTDAVSLADGLATEFSVSKRPDSPGFVAVYTENGLGDLIVGRFADKPEGPWSEPLLLARCPEMAKDKELFCYAAKAHPWAARGNELVISYCVNAWDFGRLFKDEAVYRPRFVRVELAAGK